MGYRFFDQYSILHFSVGVLMYFWSIPLLTAVIIHFIFEILENSKTGVYVINNYFTNLGILSWPGGKPGPDNLINTIGDNVFFILGYIISKQLDLYGIKQLWHKP